MDAGDEQRGAQSRRQPTGAPYAHLPRLRKGSLRNGSRSSFQERIGGTARAISSTGDRRRRDYRSAGIIRHLASGAPADKPCRRLRRGNSSSNSATESLWTGLACLRDMAASFVSGARIKISIGISAAGVARHRYGQRLVSAFRTKTIEGFGRASSAA